MTHIILHAFQSKAVVADLPFTDRVSCLQARARITISLSLSKEKESRAKRDATSGFKLNEFFLYLPDFFWIFWRGHTGHSLVWVCLTLNLEAPVKISAKMDTRAKSYARSDGIRCFSAGMIASNINHLLFAFNQDFYVDPYPPTRFSEQSRRGWPPFHRPRVVPSSSGSYNYLSLSLSQKKKRVEQKGMQHRVSSWMNFFFIFLIFFEFFDEGTQGIA